MWLRMIPSWLGIVIGPILASGTSSARRSLAFSRSRDRNSSYTRSWT